MLPLPFHALRRWVALSHVCLGLTYKAAALFRVRAGPGYLAVYFDQWSKVQYFFRPHQSANLTGRLEAMTIPLPCGAVAQLGERCVRNAEVRGSIPLGSIRCAGTAR